MTETIEIDPKFHNAIIGAKGKVLNLQRELITKFERHGRKDGRRPAIWK